MTVLTLRRRWRHDLADSGRECRRSRSGDDHVREPPDPIGPWQEDAKRRKPMRFPSQPDLFISTSSLAVDRTFATTNRTRLDADSWVDVILGWLSGADTLFDLLATGVPWKQHDRRMYDQTFAEPRLTAEYRDLREVPHQPLIDIATALSTYYGIDYDSLWLNLYRDGRDSTGWHRDRFSCRRPDCVVPVLTLGATRRFLLRPRSGGASLSFSPRSGDLIVMGGRCQEDWVHGVPKVPGLLEPRISVNFQSSMQARRQV